MVKAPLRGEKYYSGRDSSAGDSDNIDKVNSRKTNDDKNLPGAKKIRMGDNRLSKTDRDSGDGDSDYIDQVNSKKRNDGKILPAEKKMRIGDNSLSKIDERLKSLIGNAVNDITQHGNVKQKFSIILNILDVPDIEELLYNLSIKGFTKENILDKNSRMHRKFKEIQKNIAWGVKKLLSPETVRHACESTREVVMNTTNITTINIPETGQTVNQTNFQTEMNQIMI